MRGDEIHLEGPHAVLEAVARVQPQALARPDPACTPLALQGVSAAHPVLHQEAHPTAGIVPALLREQTDSYLNSAAQTS